MLQHYQSPQSPSHSIPFCETLPAILLDRTLVLSQAVCSRARVRCARLYFRTAPFRKTWMCRPKVLVGCRRSDQEGCRYYYHCCWHLYLVDRAGLRDPCIVQKTLGGSRRLRRGEREVSGRCLLGGVLLVIRSCKRSLNPTSDILSALFLFPRKRIIGCLCCHNIRVRRILCVMRWRRSICDRCIAIRRQDCSANVTERRTSYVEFVKGTLKAWGSQILFVKKAR